MILYMYGLSRTQEDVGNINLTSVRLGWLTANGREIYWDLVSRNHSRLGRHHHQPHRNIGHQNHNWDYLLLALVTTILIIIFFNSIMLIFYDAFRNHDSDHLFSWGKNAFTHWQLTQKRSGCRATADVRAQPALWLVAADCVVTASWVFVPNFSSISRSSCSQFAFWLNYPGGQYSKLFWNDWSNLNDHFDLHENWMPMKMLKKSVL